MQRTTLFGSPFLLGFEQLERLVERTAKTGGDAYPPYNIEETDTGLAITLAVAGFSVDELRVTVEGQAIGNPRQAGAGRKQNVPSPRHWRAAIFAQLCAGGWHRSHRCHVGTWIVENRFGPSCGPTECEGRRNQERRSVMTNASQYNQLERTLEGARIAYIKPTGSEEAHRLGLIPANIDLRRAPSFMCCMPPMAACSASPTPGPAPMARRSRTN